MYPISSSRPQQGEKAVIWVVEILKGEVYDYNPKQFLSNSENISSQSASFPFCVYAEKNGKKSVSSNTDVLAAFLLNTSVQYVTTPAPTQDKLMLCVT